MASEFSTSHMTPHIYWFLCTWTGSRHRPWNSIVYILVRSLQFSHPNSAIGTGFYKLLSVFALLYTPHMSKFYIPTFGSHRNNSGTVPISLYFVPGPQTGVAHIIAIFSTINTSCRHHQLPGACARDSSSLFHIFRARRSTVSMLTTTDRVSVSDKTLKVRYHEVSKPRDWLMFSRRFEIFDRDVSVALLPRCLSNFRAMGQF